MRYSRVALLGLLLGACQPASPVAQAPETVRPAPDLRVGPIRHDSLTANQVARITRIQAAFAEVLPATLAETIDDFRRDAHPDREIAVWETMAAAYGNYLRRPARPLSLPQKKGVFALLLSRSMMPAEQVLLQAKSVLLTPAEARQVLAQYEATPAPLIVR